MSATSKVSPAHIEVLSLFGLAFLMLLVLKLLDIVTWSWWIVLAPVWIGITFSVCVMAAIGWVLAFNDVFGDRS